MDQAVGQNHNPPVSPSPLMKTLLSEHAFDPNDPFAGVPDTAHDRADKWMDRMSGDNTAGSPAGATEESGDSQAAERPVTSYSCDPIQLSSRYRDGPHDTTEESDDAAYDSDSENSALAVHFAKNLKLSRPKPKGLENLLAPARKRMVRIRSVTDAGRMLHDERIAEKRPQTYIDHVSALRCGLASDSACHLPPKFRLPVGKPELRRKHQAARRGQLTEATLQPRGPNRLGGSSSSTTFSRSSLVLQDDPFVTIHEPVADQHTAILQRHDQLGGDQ
ncbi:hypothetical protein BU23DRAFT_39378 [Bimuria novae-zelandiae CBS 107.79]|uniref:Uncharacterized protein n=1 Tax=Bimuria novae-zelandiae CBS 107.79 TaxID=1447943 RepID=A0A6A5UM12_9PLEO|nr:hypothetical protein BU23DRAFT_39378 [Bimuria novae-zelandiae CBS 107.79]